MESDDLQGLPVVVEAERATLAAMMIDPDMVDDVMEIVTAADYYYERHGAIFEAMCVLHQRRMPIDMVTLVDEMDRTDTLAMVGGAVAISDLISSTPTAMYAKHYAELVRRASILRQMIHGAGRIAEAAYRRDADVESVIDEAERIIYDVAESNYASERMMTISHALASTLDSMEKMSKNRDELLLRTGFADLDRLMGGLQRQDLFLLAGRPGMGKSGLGVNLAVNVAKKGFGVAVFSLEMSTEQLVQRVLAAETAIPSMLMRTGTVPDSDWPLLLESANELSRLNLHFDDTPGVTIGELRGKARRLASRHGLDLIVVDYLQLMESGRKGLSDNRQQEVSVISRSLKALAKELNIVVIALSQLNRAVEGRVEKRPLLSDLRESGSLEQEADLVAFIYRDDYYNADTAWPNVAEVILAKHRNGATGTTKLFFQRELTNFRDLDLIHSTPIY